MVAKLDGTNGLIQQYDYQAPTTGFSYTFAAGTNVLVMNPAGTLATGTITMPASPADGMTITFSSTQAITALTVNANTGQSIVGKPTSFGVGSAATFVYRLSNTTWYPTSAYANSAIPKSSLPAGTVLQVQNVQSGSLASTTTTIPLDNTIPQNTEGAELFTVSITPTSSTSKLLITANVELSSSAGGWLIIAIFQDSTANAIAATTSYMATATGGLTIPLTYYMTSGTTSSTTFKLRYGQSAAGTTSVNASGGSQLFGGVCISSMTVMEIAV